MLYVVLLTSTAVMQHISIHSCVIWPCCQGDTRNVTWVAVALRLHVVLIGKGVLVQQRLSAMTSSVLLIRNVGTWKIVITVLTELHRQRLRPPHCELSQLKASQRSLKLHLVLLQCVQASREARTVSGTLWVCETDCCSIRRLFHSNKK
jgi:hypothetical protein